MAMDSDTWCTSSVIADPLSDFFGGPVGCDPCTNENSIVRAHRKLTFGGLSFPWTNHKGKPDSVYKNNPYSNTDPWIAKALREIKIGNVTELVGLVMVATSTGWHARLSRSPRNPRFLFTKRLKFIGDQKFGARFDTLLYYIGRRTTAFDKAFKHVTRWTSWGRT